MGLRTRLGLSNILIYEILSAICLRPLQVKDVLRFRIQWPGREENVGRGLRLEMISHKLVPKYMKQLELKSDLVSHRRYENKCVVTGQRGLVPYVRMTKEYAHTIKYSDSILPITLYVLKCDHEWSTASYDSDRQPPGRAQQRKKETSI